MSFLISSSSAPSILADALRLSGTMASSAPAWLFLDLADIEWAVLRLTESSEAAPPRFLTERKEASEAFFDLGEAQKVMNERERERTRVRGGDLPRLISVGGMNVCSGTNTIEEMGEITEDGLGRYPEDKR